MKRVVIESPLSAPTRNEMEENKSYARKCVMDSLRRNEAPYASHLFFDQPGILDDLIPSEREKGILAGFAWGEAADMVAFYVDKGVSSGMVRGFERTVKTDADVVVRSLNTNKELIVPIEIGLPGTMWEPIVRMRNINNFNDAVAAVQYDKKTSNCPSD